MKSITNFLFALFVPSILYAGVATSGGGIGVNCAGSPLKTLDLYEAEKIYGFTLPQTNSSFDEMLGHYGTRLKVHLSGEPVIVNPQLELQTLQEYTENITSRILYVPANSLIPTTDATLPELPAHCTFVQLATFFDDLAELHIDGDLWMKLNSQNRAALIMHEAMYKKARDAGFKLSDRTRFVIGQIFGDSALQPLHYDSQNVDRWSCAGFDFNSYPIKVDTAFYLSEATELGRPGVRINFTFINNFQIVSRTTGFIPHVELKKLFKVSGMTAKFQAKDFYSGETFDVKLKTLAGPSQNFRIETGTGERFHANSGVCSFQPK